MPLRLARPIRKIAEKHGVPDTVVRKRAKMESWVCSGGLQLVCRCKISPSLLEILFRASPTAARRYFFAQR